eukprot:gene7398-8809_t
MTADNFTPQHVVAFREAISRFTGVPASGIFVNDDFLGEGKGVHVISSVDFGSTYRLSPAQFTTYLRAEGSLHRDIFTNTAYWRRSITGDIKALEVQHGGTEALAQQYRTLGDTTSNTEALSARRRMGKQVCF